MQIYRSIMEIDHSKDAAIQCLKLLGQKNPENVIKESDGIYSHTNLKGKTRYLLPCLSFSKYKKEQIKRPKASYYKCIGYYVLYWCNK